jgi:hypothetical protein
VKAQLSSLLDVMMRPRPAETSQRKAPTLTCSSAEAGSAIPKTSVAAAAPQRRVLRFIDSSNLFGQISDATPALRKRPTALRDLVLLAERHQPSTRLDTSRPNADEESESTHAHSPWR